MAIAIGLDIGLQSIKIAVVEGGRKGARVLSFHHHKLEGNETTRALGPADLGDLVKRVVADARAPAAAASVVAAVPAASAFAREVTVPFTRHDQIAKTIKFQAESVFHAVSIDDLIVEFYKLAEHGEKSRVLVLGVKKDLLRERLSTLEAADLDPVAVDLDAAALYGALSITPAVREGKRVLGVDLGGGTMKMVAIEGGKLRGLRATRLKAASLKVGPKKPGRDSQAGESGGGLSLDDLKRNLSDAEREDMFFASGAEDEGRLPVVILDEEQSELFDFAEAPEAERQDVLEKVFLEIDRTLASTHMDGALDVVYLTGGGAGVEGIEKAFAEHFGAPAERVSLKDALPSKLSRPAAEAFDLYGAVALGLGLKGVGVDPSGLDFRKEEFVFQGKFERAKRGLACALVLLFVFFFVVAYRFQMLEMERLGRQQEQALKYQAIIYYGLFPEERNRPVPESFAFALNKKEKDLTQRLRGFDVPDVHSTFDMLRDIAQGFEESGKKVLLKEASLRQKQSVLKIEVENELDAFALKEAVNKKTRLVEVEEGRVQKDPKTGIVSVEVRVKTRETDKKKAAPPPPEGE